MTKEMLEKMIEGLLIQAQTFKEIADFLPTSADKQQENLYSQAEENERKAQILREQLKEAED